MEKREPYLAPFRNIAAELATANTWISIPEIAVAIGKSATTVRGLLAAGIIPGRRHGNRWYVRKVDFLAWQRGERATEARSTDLESLAAAVQALLDGRLRLVVSIESLERSR